MPEEGAGSSQPEPAASAPDGDPLIGVDVAGYVVRRRIAAGGMGLVYEARHPAIGRRAAVKVLRPEVAADESWAARFLVEARAVAALSHRNIVEILNFGQLADGRQYLMMAFLDGEPLDVTIGRRAPMPPREALGLMEQIFNGLAEAHKKGIVHRDLKPHNVMVLAEHSGELLLKLLDFGLARQEPLRLTFDASSDERDAVGGSLPSLRAGTPEYVAPEQALGQPVGAAADLYAAGVILFQMLTGALPFRSPSVVELLRLHARAPPPSLASLGARVSPELEAFVASLLAKAPADRPTSADEARATVRSLLRAEARTAPGPRGPPLESLPSFPLGAAMRDPISPTLLLATGDAVAERSASEASGGAPSAGGSAARAADAPPPAEETTALPRRPSPPAPATGGPPPSSAAVREVPGPRPPEEASVATAEPPLDPTASGLDEARRRRRALVKLLAPALIAGLGAAALGVLTRERAPRPPQRGPTTPAVSMPAPPAPSPERHPSGAGLGPASAPSPATGSASIDAGALADSTSGDAGERSSPIAAPGARLPAEPGASGPLLRPRGPPPGKADVKAPPGSRGAAGATPLGPPGAWGDEPASVERGACVPNDAWRSGARQALAELQASASGSPDLFERLVESSEEVSRLVQSAASASDCVRAQRRIEALRRLVRAGSRSEAR